LASGESALAMPRIVGLLLSCHAVRALVKKRRYQAQYGEALFLPGTR
jgi:hypothetical protein